MSGTLAAALVLGGTATNPRGIVPPAPDGVTAWAEFFNADSAVALRNLRAPTSPFSATGAPTFEATGVTMAGNSSHFVTATGQFETVDFGGMALVRLPAAPSGNHRIISNYGAAGGAGDCYVQINSSGGLLFALPLTGGAAGNPNVGSGIPVGEWDWTQWTMVGWHVGDAGLSKTLVNLSTGVAVGAALPAAHLPRATISPFRIGTSYQGTPSSAAPIEVAAYVHWSNYAPSAEEMTANAQLLKSRAAAKGIAVVLA